MNVVRLCSEGKISVLVLLSEVKTTLAINAVAWKLAKTTINKTFELGGFFNSVGNLKGISAVGASWRYVAPNNASITNFTRQGKRNI